jgi:hypothetical protein
MHRGPRSSRKGTSELFIYNEADRVLRRVARPYHNLNVPLRHLAGTKDVTAEGDPRGRTFGESQPSDLDRVA